MHVQHEDRVKVCLRDYVFIHIKKVELVTYIHTKVRLAE